MPTLHHTLTLSTTRATEVLDLTAEVREAVRASGVRDGQCLVFVPHATAAVALNENDDPNIGTDLLDALERMVPTRAGWRHDRIDGNAAAHIKAAIVGPSETIPIVDGELLLGRWQNVFLLELDGPRRARRVLVTVTW